MTAAEKIEEYVEQKGIEKVAVNLLKEDAEPGYVARITELELADILKLKAQFEQSPHH